MRSSCIDVRKESETLRRVVFDSCGHADPRSSNSTKPRAALSSVALVGHVEASSGKRAVFFFFFMV